MACMNSSMNSSISCVGSVPGASIDSLEGDVPPDPSVWDDERQCTGGRRGNVGYWFRDRDKLGPKTSRLNWGDVTIEQDKTDTYGRSGLDACTGNVEIPVTKFEFVSELALDDDTRTVFRC